MSLLFRASLVSTPFAFPLQEQTYLLLVLVYIVFPFHDTRLISQEAWFWFWIIRSTVLLVMVIYEYNHRNVACKLSV